jgi:hypothetical protein
MAHIVFAHNFKNIALKVGVLRDSHYLFSTPYRKFECFFGVKNKKTVLAGLRLKKQQWD